MNRSLEFSIPQSNWRRYRYGNHLGQLAGESFRCKYCQAFVHTLTMHSGVQNRNHCPYCLHSRHMDLHRAGDRLSACRAIMQPIGLTVKSGRSRYGTRQPGEPLAAQSGEPLTTQSGEPLAAQSGELMVVHRCSDCGELSLNRIAADDMTDVLLSLLEISSGLDDNFNLKLAQKSIRLLQTRDKAVALKKLYGNIVI